MPSASTAAQATRESYITGYPAYDCATLQPQVLRCHCTCKLAAAAAAAATPAAAASVHNPGPICSANCFYSTVTVVGDAAHPMSPFKGAAAAAANYRSPLPPPA